MKLAIAVVSSLAVALLVLGPAQSQDEPPAKKPTEKEVSIWMHQKTSLSQRVMQGLTEGDFEKIERGAVLMNLLSYFEGRAHSEDPDYKRYLGQFDLANRELVRMAKAKNLEGATLAYNQLTVSCVYCHKRLRDVSASAR